MISQLEWKKRCNYHEINMWSMQKQNLNTATKAGHLGTTRLRGRPRNKWQDEVREDGRIVGGEGWQEKVRNRDEWKKFLRTARNRHILHMPMEWRNEWTNGQLTEFQEDAHFQFLAITYKSANYIKSQSFSCNPNDSAIPYAVCILAIIYSFMENMMTLLVAHQVALLSRHLNERTEENHKYSLSVYFVSGVEHYNRVSRMNSRSASHSKMMFGKHARTHTHTHRYHGFQRNLRWI